MIKDINIRKQVTFKKSFLIEIDKQCTLDIRSLSNLVNIAVKEYIERSKEVSK